MDPGDSQMEETNKCLPDGNVPGDKEDRKNTWANKVEFILSLFGYTTGVSDFWRFPYLAWRNGGGAFVLAFMCAVVVCGIPLYFMELVVSQYSGKGIYEVWTICPLLKGVGISIGIFNIVYLGYGSLTRYWIVDYMVTSFTGLPWLSCNNTWNTNSCVTSDTMFQIKAARLEFNETTNQTAWDTNERQIFVTSEEEFWQHKVLDLSDGIGEIGEFRWNICIYALVYRVIVIIVVIKSVKSIGKAMYIFTILPILLITAMWIRTLLLPGAVDGIKFFLVPDFSQLASIRVWIEAVMMAFYTLGPVWGGIITVGSHSKFHNNCLRAAVISCTADVLNCIFCSIVLFTVLGVVASESGTKLEHIIRAGMSVGLVGYSRALSYLPLAQVWTVTFFVTVVVATMDFQILSQEMIISFLQEVFPNLLRHRRFLVVVGSSILVFILSLPFCTQGGAYMIQIIDWYHATLPILTFAVVECITFMWIYGGEKLDRVVSIMMNRRIPHIIRLSGAFVTPILLVVMLISSIMKYKPPTYGSYIYPPYIEAVGWLILVVTVLPVPIYIVFQYVKHEGPPKKRFEEMIKPCGTWILKEEELYENKRILKQKDVYDYKIESSFIKRLKYNLTGVSNANETVELNGTTHCLEEL